MNDQFTIDMLSAEVEILENRLQAARLYLQAPDIGYGLTAIGVVHLLNILNGDSDDDIGAQGQSL